MRVAVVGLGAVGASALYHLAKQGHEVVGFEQFQVGHTHGSSHGESRIFRLTYANPLYTRMMREALPLWRELEYEAGEELIVPCGVAWMGAQDDPELLAIAHALNTEQMDYDWLNPNEVKARFPVFQLQPHERMLYQNDGGFLRASACVRACLRLAQEYGALVFENAPLARFESLPSAIRLEFTNGMRVQVDRLILSVGAWLTHLLAELALPLRVTRQTYAYFGYDEQDALFSPMFLPVWIEATEHFYGFPHDGVQAGVKIAWHHLGETVDPDQPVRPMEETDLEPLRDYLSRRLPSLEADTVLHTQTCLYTNTPDERFLIQPLPTDGRIWFASACSGHGFKFAILNGKRVAEGALSGAP